MKDALRDSFNPKFVHYSPVPGDEIDPATRSLSKTRIAAHVDEAITAWCTSYAPKCDCHTDDANTIRDLYIECLEPVSRPTTLRIDIWVENLDETSCVYGFLCSSEDGNSAHARGERTVVRIDPVTHRPAPWSVPFRLRQSQLFKSLPAIA